MFIYVAPGTYPILWAPSLLRVFFFFGLFSLHPDFDRLTHYLTGTKNLFVSPFKNYIEQLYIRGNSNLLLIMDFSKIHGQLNVKRVFK